MSFYRGPKVVTNGLVLALDAADRNSYPGSGASVTDITGLGNNITLLNGVSYDQDGQGALVFDGTDDYANPNVSHSYLSSSALEVVFRSSSHGSGNKMIFGYRHNSGYAAPTIGSIYLNGSNITASLITTSQVYRSATFPSSISINTTYHVVLNKDTVNGTIQLFVNGAAGPVQTFDTTTYAQWPTDGTFIGDNILDICKSTNTNAGQGWSTDYFNGRIYKLAVYSRTLTTAEIQQNFNALRGRFGI